MENGCSILVWIVWWIPSWLKEAILLKGMGATEAKVYIRVGYSAGVYDKGRKVEDYVMSHAPYIYQNYIIINNVGTG